MTIKLLITLFLSHFIMFNVMCYFASSKSLQIDNYEILIFPPMLLCNRPFQE